MTIVGREAEKQELDRVTASPMAELVVVYGRRRVGKTFLIREYLKPSLVFELTGLHHEPFRRQLENFANRLREHSHAKASVPASWLEAFEQLKDFLRRSKKKGPHKRVVFFDEFPWLASRKSGFLAAFEEFWNGFACRDPSLVCVICGSAASWMIDKVINARGGLHNRATARLRLQTFTLGETRAFLRHRKIQLPESQIAQLYMAIGGVPHYLRHLKPGDSVAQSIDRLCFDKDGILADEFSNLYRALFEFPELHEAVVRALATRRIGLSRNELATVSGVTSGGTLTKILGELRESGFVRETPSLFLQRKHSLWRLTDEYSMFYLTWMETNRTSGKQVWISKSTGQKWKSWCGYAFENLCLSHLPQIKQALGISGILTEEASWQYRPRGQSEDGAQIDMLIDRADQSINICEMKYSEKPFLIDKRVAAELERKLRVFRTHSGSRKALFLTLVTSTGVERNAYFRDLVANSIELSDLFQ